MKMTEILEKDRDRLLTELTAAANAEKAVRILENETDRLLLRYNEQPVSEPVRENAEYIMQAVRLSLGLIDSSGRIRVWERGDSRSGTDRAGSRRGSLIPVLLAVLGIGLTLFGILPFILSVIAAEGSGSYSEIISRIISLTAGITLLFLAGARSAGTSRPDGRAEQQVEIRVDADKIYRCFRSVILSADQSLAETEAAENWRKREQAGTIEGRKAERDELELFSELLAAAYSGDGEYALEKLEMIKYYLHRQQIEVLDYSDATSQYFDLMPGHSAGTIRPAMTVNGELLRKGLASSGR